MRSATNRRARASARRARVLPLAALFAVGIVMSSISGALAYFLPTALSAVRATGQVVTLPSPPVNNPSPVATASGAPFTVLLLGSDDDEKFDPAHVLTQSMILVRVVPGTRQVTMLSIPRDLWVPLSTGGTAKIDGAYSYGGAAAAIATVQNNFGVHIDEYVWIGLKGLIRLIDTIGGIDVNTSNPVTDDYYPQDINTNNPYGYERVAVLPGPQHLDGATALKYVRSRHGDLIGDYGRSQRQQQVLLAIRQKAKQFSPADIPDLASAFNAELKTSMGVARVRELLPIAAGLSSQDSIKQIVLLDPYTTIGDVDSQSVVLPNWGLIRPLITQYFT